MTKAITKPSPGQWNKLKQDLLGLARVWPFLKPSKKQLFVAASLIPVISLLQMSLPLIIKRTVDKGVLPNQPDEIWFGVSLGILAIIGEYLTRASQTLLTANAVHKMIRSMRTALVDHIMKLSSSFHDHTMSGALVTRATSDFDNLSESLNQGVLTSIVDFALLIGAVTGLFLLNWQLALCALILLPLVAFIVVFFSRILKQTMLAARVKIATLNAFTQECLYGISTVKSLTAETDTQQKFDELAAGYRKAQMNSVKIDAFLFAILDGISSITIGIVLWFALSPFMGAASSITIGVMIAFVQYIQNLFDPLKQLGNKIAMLQGAFTSLERIFGIFAKRDFIDGSEERQIELGRIEVKGLSFSYQSEGAGQTVLQDIDFHVDNGRSLALVGATGSGKSTIIKLIAKLYQGYQGSIKIDGVDIRNWDESSLRRQIAIVPQDIVIFEGTIASNISLNAPHISQEEIRRAAELVGAQGFIELLEKGYDTEIQEGGRNLSHGQRQLLAFARALAHHPKIIILDEATSSVDPQSEAQIQAAIDNILRDRTVIVIAHRLSTIQKCDEILVLRQGQIIEQGNHQQLMQSRNYYFELQNALQHQTT